MTGPNKKKEHIEFRYYEIPQNQPVLALLGEKWVRNYGAGVRSLHFHNHMEIGYCYGGEGALALDGEAQRYRTDMISVIPKNCLHTTNSDEGTLSRWEYIFVDVEGFLQEMYPGRPLFADDVAKRVNSRALLLTAEECPDLAGIVLAICNEMRTKKEFYTETVRGLLLSLLFGIARSSQSRAGGVRSQAVRMEQIAEAMDFVGENYGRELSIADLAAAAHMSETHFRRIFQKYMNMTPLDYVNLVRVQRACEYMKKHDVPMENVAVQCGFQTVSTFHRNFKKMLGITPYQWKIHPENYEGKLLHYKISAHKGW